MICSVMLCEDSPVRSGLVVKCNVRYGFRGLASSGEAGSGEVWISRQCMAENCNEMQCKDFMAWNGSVRRGLVLF